MLRRLYDWTLEKAAHRHAERWLAAISFIESSFFPIPPDVVLGPMCLARPDKAFRYALICTIASVIGALLGYAIGMFLFDTVGQWIIGLYGLEKEFAGFADSFNDQGWAIVLLAGFTPLPFKVITIAAGATTRLKNIFVPHAARMVSPNSSYQIVRARALGSAGMSSGSGFRASR